MHPHLHVHNTLGGTTSGRVDKSFSLWAMLSALLWMCSAFLIALWQLHIPFKCLRANYTEPLFSAVLMSQPTPASGLRQGCAGTQHWGPKDQRQRLSGVQWLPWALDLRMTDSRTSVQARQFQRRLLPQCVYAQHSAKVMQCALLTGAKALCRMDGNECSPVLSRFGNAHLHNWGFWGDCQRRCMWGRPSQWAPQRFHAQRHPPSRAGHTASPATPDTATHNKTSKHARGLSQWEPHPCTTQAHPPSTCTSYCFSRHSECCPRAVLNLIDEAASAVCAHKGSHVCVICGHVCMISPRSKATELRIGAAQTRIQALTASVSCCSSKVPEMRYAAPQHCPPGVCSRVTTLPGASGVPLWSVEPW